MSREPLVLCVIAYLAGCANGRLNTWTAAAVCTAVMFWVGQRCADIVNTRSGLPHREEGTR